MLDLRSANVPGDFLSLANDLETYVPKLEESLNTALELGPALQSLLGLDGPEKATSCCRKTTTSCGPTGGFVGSMGLLTMQDGHLADMDYRDSYSFDNPDSPHLAPPTPLIKYMNATGLYLRDANWWPNFPSTALAVEQLFEQEQGKKADGVIALDLTALKYLLEFTGPVLVPDYGVEVSAGDYVAKSYYYIFSPGGRVSSTGRTQTS